MLRTRARSAPSEPSSAASSASHGHFAAACAGRAPTKWLWKSISPVAIGVPYGKSFTGPPTARQPEWPLFMYLASKPASRSLIAVLQPMWKP